MTDGITLEKITLVGFRAYLKPKTFNLRRSGKQISWFIYGPNGKGKSSLVDSLEYYFSEGGTLNRLGQRSSATQSGPNAIRHVDATKGVDTSVHVWFRQGRDKFDDSRPANSLCPPAAKRVLNLTKVPFVIRGYELRRFVEYASPTEQYEELIGWFELEPFLVAQNNLKKLKQKIDVTINNTTETDGRLRDLASTTGDSIQKWDEPTVLDWLNDTVIVPLDKSLELTTLSDDDPALQELKLLAQTEQERSGLETLKSLLGVIDELRGQSALNPADPDGQINSFETYVSKYKTATTEEVTMRSTTREAVFGEVWEKAKNLLEGDAEFDECPVCGTRFTESPRKSRSDARAVLSLNLDRLREYREAEAARRNAEGKLDQATRNLKETLKRFFLLAGSEYPHDAVAAYNKALQSWEIDEPKPDSKGAVSTLARLHDSVNADIERVEQQSRFLYNETLATVSNLLRIKSELKRIARTKEELHIIQDNLDRQALEFDTAITKHIEILMDELQEDIRSIYAHIQGPNAKVPLIRIELAKKDAANQRTARVLIDFADRCKGAIPSSFLSDSQIHTLALSIRLAAIRKFNVGAKIIALDDIVTSYDIDHRKSIASMLGKCFGDFQIILTTHDRHFFDILKDHFHEKHCAFHEIKELRSGIGPMFETHLMRDEEIEEKLDKGIDAGNDVRKAEEEWLYRMCQEFETLIRFKRNSKPSLSELAASLNRFLNKSGLGSPTLPGSSVPFLESMQKATIENLGSHAEYDPDTSPSSGDARARWEEFKRFREMFVCPECSKKRFKRSGDLEKPVCQKCETPFGFEH